MAETLEITPQELKRRLDGSSTIIIIDVREPHEFALARLEGSESVPMGNVPNELQRLEALAEERGLAILCHHGVRSLKVTAWLRAQGIEDCYSVAGGLDRWSLDIDPRIPRY